MSQVVIRDKDLLSVDKPARYIGNEVNAIMKPNPESYPVRICFCFPDNYEVGMSNLGLQLLYDEINSFPQCYCERSFAPWTDMEQLMREKHIPLYTLETFTPLKEMDFVAFTLQYEMAFTNVINMLDLAGIPIYAKDRTEEDPLVIAGGPTASNPEVMAPFVDVFYIGEGEVSYEEFFRRYEEHKKNGGKKRDFLGKILDMGPFYVPAFYDVIYEDHPAEGCERTPAIKAFVPNRPDAPMKIRKDIQMDLDHTYYPTKPIIPNIQVIHDRAMIEIFRGCTHGCRFCQAGQIYKPVRFRSKETVLRLANEMMENTGFDEISFTSLSTDDYPWLYELMSEFRAKYPHVGISLPSLRVDAFSLELMEKLAEGKKSGLTFACEAGTQRLRDVINKGITEKEVLKGCDIAFSGGWNKVKLYYMLGLPTETMEDVLAISEMGNHIVYTWKKCDSPTRSMDVQVTVSTSFFVPKSFTAFQWAPQNSTEEFMAKQAALNEAITNKKIRYSCHDAFVSSLEGLLARGDRRVAQLIYAAWKNGCRFDAWSDQFKEEGWIKALEETGLELAYYNYRERPKDEVFPWELIDYGVSKQWLWNEYQKAKRAEATGSCDQKCTGCGMMKFSECMYAPGKAKENA